MPGFSKSERVSSKLIINALFAKGNFSLYENPFRFSWVFVEPNLSACQVLIVSSKKKLKTSVERNRQKRQLRELYRLNKNALLDSLVENQLYIAVSINYIGIEPIKLVPLSPIFKNALLKIARAAKKNSAVSLPAAH